MKKGLLYGVAFVVLWQIFVYQCSFPLWGWGAPGLFGRKPSSDCWKYSLPGLHRGRFAPSLAMPALRKATRHARNVFQVAPHMPLLCAKLRETKVRAWKLMGSSTVHEVKQSSEFWRTLRSRWGLSNNKDDQLLVLRADAPGFVLRVKSSAFGEPLETLLGEPLISLPKRLSGPGSYLVHWIRRMRQQDIRLKRRRERFFVPEPRQWEPLYSFSDKTCFRLPREVVLRKGYFYEISEQTDDALSGYRAAFLQPIPMPKRVLARPSLRLRYARHKGLCEAHGAVVLEAPSGVQRHLYRWRLVRLDTMESIGLWGGSWGEFPARGQAPRSKTLIEYIDWYRKGGKTPPYIPDGAMIGTAPGISSLWLVKSLLGKRLRLQVQAIHPSGAISAPQNIDFRLPVTWTKAQHQKEKALRQFIGKQSNQPALRAMLFWEGVLLVFVLLGTWRQRQVQRLVEAMEQGEPSP